MKRKLILLLPLVTSFVTACGDSASTTSEVISEARNQGDDPPDWPPPEEDPPPPPPPPLTSPTLEITQRASTQITLQWRDNTDQEYGNFIERMDATNNTFTTIATLGSKPLGVHNYVDTTVSPDSSYCYRVKNYNATSTRYSPIRCAWTTATTPQSVWRLQLRVEVADVGDAGTDDTVRVRLNAPSGDFPYGNVTAMDYGRDDFERNSVWTYDLDMVGISDMADINRIELDKHGEDGVCIRSFALIVNELEVFSRHFGNSSSTCHWLDYGSGQQTTFVVSHGELRSHSSWLAYTTQIPDFLIQRLDLERRFEGLIGNAINGSALKWGHYYGRAVEITKISANIFHIDLDLEAHVNNWPNPEVDVDMDMHVGFVPSATTPNSWELVLTTIGSSVNVDYSWYWEVMSIVIDPLCIPIGIIATGDMWWDCATSIEDYTENRVENALQPIEKAFNVGNLCTPAVEVQDDGDLQFSCMF